MTESPSLLVTLTLMEDTGSSMLYDRGTGCHVYRDEDGNLELSNESGYTRTLRSLIENECRGLRGVALCNKVKEVMANAETVDA